MVDVNRIENAYREILLAIGEDLQREGIKDTPKRAASVWKEFIEFDAGKTDTVFQTIASNQMVIVKDIKVWSMCEHHLLPFWCKLCIAYITSNEKILGLSKFARIANKHAHRLRNQEELVHDIAKEIINVTSSKDVGVIATGEHLCMCMRGIKTEHKMISSSMHGIFTEDHTMMNELLKMT
jgi:GTP cyclohydrolase I